MNKNFADLQLRYGPFQGKTLDETWHLPRGPQWLWHQSRERNHRHPELPIKLRAYLRSMNIHKQSDLPPPGHNSINAPWMKDVIRWFICAKPEDFTEAFGPEAKYWWKDFQAPSSDHGCAGNVASLLCRIPDEFLEHVIETTATENSHYPPSEHERKRLPPIVHTFEYMGFTVELAHDQNPIPGDNTGIWSGFAKGKTEGRTIHTHTPDKEEAIKIAKAQIDQLILKDPNRYPKQITKLKQPSLF